MILRRLNMMQIRGCLARVIFTDQGPEDKLRIKTKIGDRTVVDYSEKTKSEMKQENQISF